MERAEGGERTICTDEMTGIQANERKAPDLPLRPGKSPRREFEYIRHGTQSLIASFDVVSGQVICPLVGGVVKTSWLGVVLNPDRNMAVF